MKRSIDVGVAALGLIAGSPILAIAALAIKLDSRGPVLYRAPRVGLGGRKFTMYKLRTMRPDADRIGPSLTVQGDLRVTRAGHILRRLKVDELPQLLNVLIGDMSLVGPRPEHPTYVQQYTDRQRNVLAVRPGITSPASIRFSNEEALMSGGDPERRYLTEIMPAKLEIELEYLRHVRFRDDFRILLQTIGLVARRVAWRASAQSRTR